MNYANDGAKYGVDQYRFAHNYDLIDQQLVINSCDKKYTFSFTSRDKLTFDSGAGEQIFDCECLKIEADTYFVRFGADLAVFDISQGLATLALSGGYVFGAVEIPDRGTPDASHHFTDEMTGTGVRWVLGCAKYTDRIYISADQCRAAWAPESEVFSAYQAKYVKIKDGIYLVDVTGPVPDGACAPAGCDRIIALEDYEHMLLAGCVFSKSGAMMIGGYGEFPEFSQDLFS
ncbi:MAG: hypothetical protein LBH09_05810 [Peptococcaceae bacterium]|jgi:hypothetical protein|nr:hypothetical protein [Peptococcaceae bacterium]